jgi:hypothetical protein
VVDGAGYTFGPGSISATAIVITSETKATTRVIIKNFNIVGYCDGILVNSTADDTDSNCWVIENKISDASRYAGIILKGNNNTIIGNVVSGEGYGSSGIMILSHSNTILGNTFRELLQGVYLRSVDNKFYLNNFLNNSKNVATSRDVSVVNFFDNGTTGNYWSDYNGNDNNGDGVGDTAYISYELSNIIYTDEYPLMEPFEEAAIFSLIPSPTATPSPSTFTYTPSSSFPAITNDEPSNQIGDALPSNQPGLYSINLVYFLSGLAGLSVIISVTILVIFIKKSNRIRKSS